MSCAKLVAAVIVRPGHHREDGRERDRRDDAEQDLAAQLEGEQRCRRVLPARRREDRLRADECRRPVAEHQREQVEDADQPDRHDHGLPGLLGGRHRVEAHEHVRQARGTEHQGQRERQEVELRHGGRAVLQTRLEDRLTVLAGHVHGPLHDGGEVEAEVREHPDRHGAGTQDEQRRLDDLHPRGALHAAHQHVQDHEPPDDGDDQALARLVGDAEQERDEPARTRHLGQQVEEHHRERGQRGGQPDRPLLQAERQHVGHGELAGVAQQLGDEQQRHEPGDEEADGVQEAVVPVDGDRARDAQEARRGQVVAGDRRAVLRAREVTAARIEVRCGLVLPGHAEDDDRA